MTLNEVLFLSQPSPYQFFVCLKRYQKKFGSPDVFDPIKELMKVLFHKNSTKEKGSLSLSRKIILCNNWEEGE